MSSSESESADAWLRQFLNYCAYKGYDDDKTKALFRVLLVECAAVWFDSLEEAVQHDWTQLNLTDDAKAYLTYLTGWRRTWWNRTCQHRILGDRVRAGG